MAAKFFTGLPLDGPDPECVQGPRRAGARGSSTGAPRSRRWTTRTGGAAVPVTIGSAARRSARATRTRSPGCQALTVTARGPLLAGRRRAAGRCWRCRSGATEQHGPHLPLSTDTDIARSAVRPAGGRARRVLVARRWPTAPAASTPGSPGRCRSARRRPSCCCWNWAGRRRRRSRGCCSSPPTAATRQPVARAVARLRAESRNVEVFQPHWDGDPHAGRPETALQLLRPGGVRMDRAVAGDRRPLGEILPLLRDGGVRAVTPTGVLGDPTAATPAYGGGRCWTTRPAVGAPSVGRWPA